MALDASKAFVAVTGSANSFPADTPIEYGANAPIPEGYTDHGLATDAGVVYGPNRSITTIRGWQNAQIIRSLVTEADFTVTVTLAQILDDQNKALAYGRTKNAVTGGYHIDPSQTGGVRSWIFDAIDPSRGKKVRVYIPRAEVTEVGEISWLSSELSTLSITLTTYPVVIEGESANAIEWTDDWTPDNGGGNGGDGGPVFEDGSPVPSYLTPFDPSGDVVWNDREDDGVSFSYSVTGNTLNISAFEYQTSNPAADGSVEVHLVDNWGMTTELETVTFDENGIATATFNDVSDARYVNFTNYTSGA